MIVRLLWNQTMLCSSTPRSEETLTLEELRSFAESKLARYKLPLKLHVVPQLPRNPAGKVLKFQLREQLS